MALRYDRCTVETKGATPGGTAALVAARDAVTAAWADGTYGFLGCPDIDTAPFEGWAGAIVATGRFDTQVVFGIGGSSLGARAILATATGDLDGLDTYFSENMDPIEFGRLFDRIDLSRTLFIVITKSGTTIETMSKFWYAWNAMESVAGEHRHKHFIAITDPEKGALRVLAEELGLTSFDVPANVGGRFSVLTAVGLVPLALAGYPIAELMAGARDARDAGLSAAPESSAILAAANDHVALHAAGHTATVIMAYSDLLGPLVEWLCQLWGESLGKATTRAGETVEIGLTPIKAVGVVDQHSQLQLYSAGPRDKHVVFVEVEQFERDVEIPLGLSGSLSHLSGKSMSSILTAELRGTRAALHQDARPHSTWRMDRITAANVGAFILAWELITAIVGELWDIDAFDQPGVELGKKISHGLLGREGFADYAALATAASDDTLRFM